MKKVIIYSTPSCSYCKIAKDFFAKNNIKYTEFNVVENQEKQKEMIEKSGQYGVPVIDIDGKLVIGFDRGKIRELLNL